MSDVNVNEGTGATPVVEPVQTTPVSPEAPAVEVKAPLGKVGHASVTTAWATADAAAPEVQGVAQATQAAALTAGWFGVRHNNHADVDYSIQGLGGGPQAAINGSPGDWDNQYDAPGGVDWGAGSYDGTPLSTETSGE